MDSFDKTYATSTLVAAAGCEAVTFRAWRNRNGLFPETKGGTKWNRFSVLDICVARTVTMLTAHGISAADAVWYSQEHCKPALSSWLSGPESAFNIPPIIGIYMGMPQNFDPNAKVLAIDKDGNRRLLLRSEEPASRITMASPYENETVEAFLNRTSGISTIIDLRMIIRHVAKQLEMAL